MAIYCVCTLDTLLDRTETVLIRCQFLRGFTRDSALLKLVMNDSFEVCGGRGFGITEEVRVFLFLCIFFNVIDFEVAQWLLQTLILINHNTHQSQYPCFNKHLCYSQKWKAYFRELLGAKHIILYLSELSPSTVFLF